MPDDGAGPSNAPEPSEEQEEEDASDLQVAWEHFETARLIWSKEAANYASELAGETGPRKNTETYLAVLSQ